MKLLFHIHSLGKGGAERVLTQLAGSFAGDGNDVVIVTEEYAAEEYELPRGVRRIHAGVVNRHVNLFTRYYCIRKRIAKLRTCILQEQPDVVIAFEKSSNYRALQAAKHIRCCGRRLPVIVSVRNDPARSYQGRAIIRQKRELLNGAAGCVFQTEEAMHFFPEQLQRKSRIIWNPIHEKYLHTEFQETREPFFANVGRMAPQKNQELLIRAFARVHRQYPNYQLRIYGGSFGDGTDERLKELVCSEALGDVVHFMGVSDQLEQELPTASGLVLSSDYEGMPNVVMEAMAMGLAVVATDCPCGGPRTLIEDGVSGILVPVQDEEALAEAMCLLAESPQRALEMGRNAMAIRQKANTETIYREWKRYVMEILAEMPQNGE